MKIFPHISLVQGSHGWSLDKTDHNHCFPLGSFCNVELHHHNTPHLGSLHSMAPIFLRVVMQTRLIQLAGRFEWLARLPDPWCSCLSWVPGMFLCVFLRHSVMVLTLRLSVARQCSSPQSGATSQTQHTPHNVSTKNTEFKMIKI